MANLDPIRQAGLNLAVAPGIGGDHDVADRSVAGIAGATLGLATLLCLPALTSYSNNKAFLEQSAKKTKQSAALFAAGPELAVLDEPTNHLDLLSIEMLESALAEYGGALLVVSHDARFLEHVRPSALMSLP